MILRGGVEREYALALTKKNMLPYYQSHHLTWNDEDFRQNWEKTTNWAIRYLPQNAVVGVLRFFWNADKNTVYLKDLQIESSFRNRGIGSQCLEYLLDYTNLNGGEIIKLRVFDDNPAVSLYQRLGFVEVNRENGLIAMMLSFDNSVQQETGS